MYYFKKCRAYFIPAQLHIGPLLYLSNGLVKVLALSHRLQVISFCSPFITSSFIIETNSSLDGNLFWQGSSSILASICFILPSPRPNTSLIYFAALTYSSMCSQLNELSSVSKNPSI